MIGISTGHKLNRKKAAGPGGIVIEMLEALDDFGIDMITDIIHEIYNKDGIPEELSRSMFIALRSQA